VDDEELPFSFVQVEGSTAETCIGGRYVGTELAESYGRPNPVPPQRATRARDAGEEHRRLSPRTSADDGL
jgi:hypothetical protein